MTVNSRRKGANVERAIARDLRAWLGTDWTVKRLRTDEQQGTEDAGEFAIRGPFRFPFAIEVKAHKALTLQALWRPTKLLQDFWHQADSQARRCGRLPLLVVRVDNRGTYAIMRWSVFSRLRLHRWPHMRIKVPITDLDREDLGVIQWPDLMAVNALMLAEVGDA